MICFHNLGTSADLSWDKLTEFDLFSLISIDCYISIFKVETYIYGLFIYCLQLCRELLLHEQYFYRNPNIWFLYQLVVLVVRSFIIFHHSFYFHFHLFHLFFFIILFHFLFALFLVRHFLRDFICLTNADCVLIFIIHRVVHVSVYIIVDIKDLVLFIYWNHMNTAFNRWEILELT